jgi:hypothetical protein
MMIGRSEKAPQELAVGQAFDVAGPSYNRAALASRRRTRPDRSHERRAV